MREYTVGGVSKVIVEVYRHRCRELKARGGRGQMEGLW